MNLLEGSIGRLSTALAPSSRAIREFILRRTRLNGRVYSLHHHEYQGIIIDTIANNPDIDLVVQKPSQVGLSEVIYRVMLAKAHNIRGHAAAVVFPSVTQASEIFKTRIDLIIRECPELKNLLNTKIDSSFLKMFYNNSILYALGASVQSKSTVITRPIASIYVDEVARCNPNVITAMRSRQRHQEHKSTVMFSTPLFAGFDIDNEMQKCGIIYRALLECALCGHKFFPEFYDHVRIPGFDDPIRTLSLKHVEKGNLDINESFLQCPKCSRAIPFGYPHTKWVDVAEVKNRPKTGVKIGAFEAPSFVSVSDMVKDFVMMDDKAEFDNQVRGEPSAAEATSIDINEVKFDTAPVPITGPHVFGLDIGKVSWLLIAKVNFSERSIYVHTIQPLKLKNIKQSVKELCVETFHCQAGVIDYMPYTDLTTEFIDTIPNSWAALYKVPNIPQPEMFTLKMKDDDAIGKIRIININMNPAMDYFANHLMTGGIVYKKSALDAEVMSHLQGMRRVRDFTKINERIYKWVKPHRIGGRRIADHIFHSSLYCLFAGRLVMKSEQRMVLPGGCGIGSFKVRVPV